MKGEQRVVGRGVGIGPARARAFPAAWPGAALALLAAACSSGLEGEGARGTSQPAQPAPSTNLRFAFDPCLRLTSPITDFALAGGVLPRTGGSGERPVVFFAFVTEAAADDADGAGTPLDPDAPADANGASDVFVAAIDGDAIDTSAFSYALAGKMRHPRCTTCHQMNVDVVADPTALPPTAFATASVEHMRPPLGQTTDASCRTCHFRDWMAPAAQFDLRQESTRDLFQRAQIAPSDLAEHFLTDSRVLWALGDGVSPFGNAADDDQDGVDEPEDRDGVVRTVPGGEADFRRRFQEWEAGGLRFDSAEDALADVALASRAASGSAAGDAASFSPSAAYVPNPAYVHGSSNPDVVPVGFVHLAFASDATNMAGGATNGATDVFWARLSVFQRSSGAIDLVYALQALASVPALGGQANGASDDPDLGGMFGERVAFHSTATNLVAGGGGGDDVYVHDVGLGTTDLVSHVPGQPGVAGDGPSRNPDLSPDGSVVAFESDATDLVAGDTNGARDVFWAEWTTLDVFRASVGALGQEGTGGDARDASVYAFPLGAGVRVAFEAEMQDLVSAMPLAGTNVFLRDTRNGGTTLLLNQVLGPAGARMPTASTTGGAPARADAYDPVIAPGGQAVLFVSDAQDLDFVRPRDENRASDVMLADLLQLDAQGFVLPYALSVTADGGHANGASRAPRVGAFAPATDAFPLGVAAFATAATNLGNADVADLDDDGVPDTDSQMLLFLREGASVLAHFEALPAVQGMNRAVAFEDRSSGQPTSRRWSFGDGQSSTEASPSHVYDTPGFYSVQLEVEGPLGSDQRRRENVVRVLGPVMAQFVGTKDASQSGAPAQAAASDVPNATTIVGALDDADDGARLSFSFDAAPSTELPDSFEWSLVPLDGGGAPVGTPVVVSAASTAEDVLVDATGAYEVRLAAEGLGGAGEATQRLEVYRKVEAAFGASSSVSGNAPLQVTFQDQSSGDVASVQWDFDDGAGSSQSNPSHTFAAGVYDVSLTAFGAGGDQDTSAPLQIVSLGDITANFSASPSQAIASGAEDVTFTNTTSGTLGVPLSYRWAFGNGQTSTATSPSTSYTLSNPENRQQFTVTLVASTDSPAPASCSGLGATECDSVSGTITLYPALSVDFSNGASFSSPSTRPPHTVSFSGSVVGDGTGTNPTYQWLRSPVGGLTPNVVFSSALSPTFEFSDPGTYRVLLRVSTDGPFGTRQTVDSPTRIVNVSAARFSTFFTNAVVASACTDCHAGASPPAGLLWTGTASQARARLVNEDSGCITGWVRVVPNAPASSILYDVLNTSGATQSGCASMRVNLVAPQSDHVATLRSWILGGALND